METADLVGQESGTSRMHVCRYIRLTELLPKLLDMVDKKRLALSVGVELSYLNKNMQQWIYEYIRKSGKIKQEQLMGLHQYRDDTKMTQEQLAQ